MNRHVQYTGASYQMKVTIYMTAWERKTGGPDAMAQNLEFDKL